MATGRITKKVLDYIADINKQAKQMKYVKELTQENAKFDLILLDFANKEYINVLKNCLKILSKDGMLIADNIDLPGCKEFKERIQVHPKLNTEIIGIGNGMSSSMFKN